MYLILSTFFPQDINKYQLLFYFFITKDDIEEMILIINKNLANF